MEKYLAQATGVAAGVSALSIGASVIFEFGYFLAIDIDLMRLAESF